MDSISALLVVGIFIHHTFGEELSSVPQNVSDTSQVDTVQPRSEVIKRPNLVTIDLSECTCSRVSSCDLTISKTPLREINCGEGEGLCCSITKTAAAAATTTTTTTTLSEASTDEDEPTEVAPRGNVRVYSITPTVIRDFNTSMEASPIKSQKGKNKKCTCKARDSCPQKYVDYGFGFFCSYSTVRCCIPEEESADSITISVDMENEKVENQPVSLNINTTLEMKMISDSGPIPAASSENTENFDMAIGIDNNSSSAMNVTDTAETNEPTIMLTVTDAGNPIDNASMPEFNMENNVSSIALVDDLATGGDEEKVEQESQELARDNASEGNLTITEITDWRNVEDDNQEEYQQDNECFCLPIQKCRIEGTYGAYNMIDRRRDTLCPADLIQCCGRDIMSEITKKQDDVTGEYDGVHESGTIPTGLDGPQPPPEQVTRFTSSPSDALPAVDDTIASLETSAPTSQVVQNVPTSAFLPAPFPGYQPPGFHRGYVNNQNNNNNQYPSNAYLSNGQQEVSNLYYRNGQQQQFDRRQSEFGIIGGQAFMPWSFSNYAPNLRNEQLPEGPFSSRNPYPDYPENDNGRQNAGGILDTISKYLG